MILSPELVFLLRREISSYINCCVPGIVTAFDADTQTVSVQPALMARFGEEAVHLPLLQKVPVVFPSAGGYSFLAVPQAGDECLVVFADGAIDRWMATGQESVPPAERQHDLSDGFAILGCWSQAHRKQSFPSSGCVLQKDDGSAGFKVDGQSVKAFTPSATITLANGNIEIQGTLNINGTAYTDHKHSGVEAGGSTTGGVTG